MKRCPECGRDYNDPTLSFCLDDGTALLDGPASVDEPATAILPDAASTSESPTRTFEQDLKAQDDTDPSAANHFGGKIPRSRVAVAAAGLVIIGLIVAGVYWTYFPGSGTQIASIAVMPFFNESGDEGLEYLADGMTDSLITSLASIPDLSVKARSSVFRYKGEPADARKLGTDLSVEAVLFGRLTKKDDELTLRLEVVATESETVLWSESFTRGLDGLASLQKEIAQDVSKKLRAKLSSREEQTVTRSYADNSESQRHYLLGKFHLAKREIGELEKAAVQFEKAIELEPDNALAYAGLADTFGLMPVYGRSVDPKVIMPRAKAAALKALELNEELSEAHASLGRTQGFYERDFSAAERSFRRSIDLDPENGSARIWYSQLLSTLGRHDEALEQARKALESEPSSLAVNRTAGDCFMFVEEFERAAQQYKKTLEFFPADPSIKMNLAWLYVTKGRLPEAGQMAMESIRSSVKDPVLLNRYEKAFEKEGWIGVRRVMLEFDLEQKRTQPFFRSYSIAVDYAALGDLDKTLEYLEKAVEERDINLNFIRLDESFRKFRDDAGFKKIVQKIGFPS